MDKSTHVYCTLCKNGEKLMDEIMKEGPTKEPESCKGCYSWNPRR